MKKRTKPQKKQLVELDFNGLTFSGFVDSNGSLILSAKKTKRGHESKGLSGAVIWGLLFPGEIEPEHGGLPFEENAIELVLQEELGNLKDADLKSHTFKITADKVNAMIEEIERNIRFKER